MFNWSLPQAKVTAALKLVGFQVSIAGYDGKNGKCYAVWDESKKSDENQMSSRTTTDAKTLMVSAGKFVPKVGDRVSQGSSSWIIDAVEPVMPATVVVVYKLTVSA